MSHVGIERFGSRNDENDGAHREKRGHRIGGEELERVQRIERGDHGGPSRNFDHAERGQRHEPHAHHRAEHRADRRGAALLDREQHEHDHDGDRNDPCVQAWRDHLQPFDGAEHRDRRRDHAVAVEHRRAENAEANEPPAPARVVFESARHKRSKRKDAAFPAVVRAHDQRHVLQRDDDHQRPEKRRQDAEHVVVRQRERVRPGERGAQRVQRARADVAVDDADGANHQRRHPLSARHGCDGCGHGSGPKPAFSPRFLRRAAKNGC